MASLTTPRVNLTRTFRTCARATERTAGPAYFRTPVGGSGFAGRRRSLPPSLRGGASDGGASFQPSEQEKQGWEMRKVRSRRSATSLFALSYSLFAICYSLAHTTQWRTPLQKEASEEASANVGGWELTLNWNHITPNLIVGSCPRSASDVVSVLTGLLLTLNDLLCNSFALNRTSS